MRSDILFNLSYHGAQQRRNLKILHGFTDSVSRNFMIKNPSKHKKDDLSTGNPKQET